MKVEYKNRLPHIAPVGATFFVTFRLGDSLPYKIVVELKQELNTSIEKLAHKNKREYQKKINNIRFLLFKKYDHQLDHLPYGNCYLRIPEIAEIVQLKLHELDGDNYDLIAYTIMPNHVHLLIDTLIQLVDEQGLIYNEIPQNYTQLDVIMKNIKGGSAFNANRALGREGKFWQKDSFDHYVRDEREFANIINYILQNPVKAGLVENWSDYPYTYLKRI